MVRYVSTFLSDDRSTQYIEHYLAQTDWEQNVGIEMDEMNANTPKTAGGPGGRDRTLAVKSRKNVRKITFFSLKNKIYPKKIFFFAYIF